MRLSGYVVGGCVILALAAMLPGYVAAQEGVEAGEEAAATPTAAPKAPPASDVLIVWSGGRPDAPPLPPVEAGPVDAVTQSTPEAGNVKEVAEKLGKELEAAGYSVLVIAAEECRDPRQVMQAKALVLGSPEYFGLPPWQMVRFFDETLYRLYRARVRLTDHVVAAFSTNERCLDVLESVLKSTQGKAVEGAVIGGRRASAADREGSIKRLAERIAGEL